jgi:hypothetical protein
MASTALQIVNRVLRKLSKSTIGSAFTDQNLGNVTLDAVNEATRAILETHSWDSLKRRDGILVTQGVMTAASGSGLNAIVTNTSTALSQSTAFGDGTGAVDNITGDMVSYLTFTEDASYGDTPFRVVSAARVNDVIANIVIETLFPGATDADAAFEIMVPEYVLPDTVKSVLSVRYEEEEINLEPIDETTTLDQFRPNLRDDTGSPEVVAVGGTSVRTFDTEFGATAEDPGLRMIVAPVPDAAYVLHYTYSLKTPTLVEVTDTLDGVSETLVDDIVQRATALMQLTTGESDLDLASANMQLSDTTIQLKRARSRADGGRVRRVASLDQKGRRNRLEPNVPRRNFGSLD